MGAPMMRFFIVWAIMFVMVAAVWIAAPYLALMLMASEELQAFVMVAVLSGFLAWIATREGWLNQ